MLQTQAGRLDITFALTVQESLREWRPARSTRWLATCACRHEPDGIAEQVKQQYPEHPLVFSSEADPEVTNRWSLDAPVSPQPTT
jgi:hypothetical protein